MDIKELRKKTHLSCRLFAERYNVPQKTIEAWDQGIRKPPAYVKEMLFKRVERDLFLMKVIENVCDDLKIEVPTLDFALEKKSKGNIAALVLNQNRKVKGLSISDDMHLNDLVFSIVHELRHAYQLQYQPGIFENYHEIGTIGFEEYNLQKAEVDANAYAALFVEKNFGIRPLWKGYSVDVQHCIEKRKREIHLTEKKEEAERK